MRKLALIAALCVAVVLPGHAQDKAAFQALADQWAEAFNKGDLAKVGQMYAEDAVLLPLDVAMVRGKDAIQAYWKKEAERTGDLKVTVTDVKPLGTDAAHTVFTSTIKTKGAQAQEIPGKGATLAQKAGGDWKIVSHVWNRDQ